MCMIICHAIIQLLLVYISPTSATCTTSCLPDKCNDLGEYLTSYNVSITDLRLIHIAKDPHVRGGYVELYQQEQHGTAIFGAQLKVVLAEGRCITTVNGLTSSNRISLSSMHKRLDDTVVRETLDTYITQMELHNNTYLSCNLPSDMLILDTDLGMWGGMTYMGQGPIQLFHHFVCSSNHSDSPRDTHDILVHAHQGSITHHTQRTRLAIPSTLYDSGHIYWEDTHNTTLPSDQEMLHIVQAEKVTQEFFYNFTGVTLEAHELVFERWPDCVGAAWNGNTTQPRFNICEGYGLSRDIITHELAHLFEQQAAFDGLAYHGQSGALSESFSNIIAESIDIHLDGTAKRTVDNCVFDYAWSRRWVKGDMLSGAYVDGYDTVADLWEIGHGVGDLLLPTCYYHNTWQRPFPRYVSDAVCSQIDAETVHFNSYIPSFAFVLLADGPGVENEYNVETDGIGLTKALHIYMRAKLTCQTSLTSFVVHADCLQQACDALSAIGQDLIHMGGHYSGDTIVSHDDCLNLAAVIEVVGLQTKLDCEQSQLYNHFAWYMYPNVLPTSGGKVTILAQGIETNTLTKVKCFTNGVAIPTWAYEYPDTGTQVVECFVPAHEELLLAGNQTYIRVDCGNGKWIEETFWSMSHHTEPNMALTFYEPPKLTSVTPISGSVFGGTIVTVCGENFHTFEGCTNVSYEHYGTFNEYYDDCLQVHLNGELIDLISYDMQCLVFQTPPAPNWHPGGVALEISVDGWNTVNYPHVFEYINVATLDGMQIVGETCDIGPFDPHTYEYSCQVVWDVLTLHVNVQPTDTNATVHSNCAPITLQDGSNLAYIDVISSDGVFGRRYWLSIERIPSTDSSLAALAVSGCVLDPEFDADVVYYYCDLPFEYPTIETTVVANNTQSSVRVETFGDTVDDQSSVVYIDVYAPDGSTTHYRVYVTHILGNGVELVLDMVLCQTTCLDAFTPDTFQYNCSVDPSTYDVSFLMDFSPLVDLATISVRVINDEFAYSNLYNNLDDPDGDYISCAFDNSMDTNIIEVHVWSTELNGYLVYLFTVTMDETNRADVPGLAEVGFFNGPLPLSTSSACEMVPDLNHSVFDYNVTCDFDLDTIGYDWNVYFYFISYIDYNHGWGALELKEDRWTTKWVWEQNSDFSMVERYTFNLYRPRTQVWDSSLASLEFTGCVLVPEFQSTILEYVCLLETDNASVSVSEAIPSSQEVVFDVVSSPTSVHNVMVGAPQSLVVEATAEDGTNTQYQITVTVVASTDSELSLLSFTGCELTPEFNQQVVEGYVCYAPSEKTAVGLYFETSYQPDAFQPQPCVVVSGNYTQLGYGDNTVTVTVLAVDNTTTTTYLVNVFRLEESNKTLIDISITDCDLVFNTAIREYNCYLPTTTTSVVVTPVHQIDPTLVYYQEIQNVSIGNNYIYVVTTTKNQQDVFRVVYVFNVMMPYRFGVIVDLGFAGCAYTPNFSPNETTYACVIPSTMRELTIEPIPAEGGVVGVYGSMQTTTKYDTAISLVSISQDVMRVSTYRVLVRRAPSGDATLSAWDTTSSHCSFSFDPSVLNYTCIVDPSVSLLFLEAPTPSDIDAVVVLKKSGGWNTHLQYSPSSQLIIATCTASDNITTMNYTVEVFRGVETTPPRLVTLVTTLGCEVALDSDVFEYNCTMYSHSDGVFPSNITVTAEANEQSLISTVLASEMGAVQGLTSSEYAYVVGTSKTEFSVDLNKMTANEYTLTINVYTIQNGDYISVSYQLHIRLDMSFLHCITMAFYGYDVDGFVTQNMMLDYEPCPVITSYTTNVSYSVVAASVEVGWGSDTWSFVSPLTVQGNGITFFRTDLSSPRFSDQINLTVGSNLFAVYGLSTTYLVDIVRLEASRDNSLQKIIVSPCTTIEIQSQVSQYSCTPPDWTDYVLLSATPTSGYSSILYPGMVNLSVDTNTTVEIEVVAQNGDMRTYTINITRDPTQTVTNNTTRGTQELDTLTFSHNCTLTPPFVSADAGPYTCSFNSSVSFTRNLETNTTYELDWGVITTTINSFYTVIFEPMLLGDATLNELTITDCDIVPQFDSRIHSYFCEVPITTTRVSVQKKASTDGSTIDQWTHNEAIVDGEDSLVMIRVQADDLTTNLYQVRINRTLSSSVGLKSLYFRRSCELVPPFYDLALGVYSCTLRADLDYITPEFEPLYPGTTLTGYGNDLIYPGISLVSFKAISADGSNTSWVDVLVNRSVGGGDDGVSTLNDLEVSGCDVGLVLSQQFTGYECVLEQSTTTLVVSATTTDPRATVGVEQPSNLRAFWNNVTVTVTSADSLTTSTYRVSVYHPGYDNTALTALSLRDLYIFPLTPWTRVYEYAVSNSLGCLYVDVATSDSSASWNSSISTNCWELTDGWNVNPLVVTSSSGHVSTTYNIAVWRTTATVSIVIPVCGLNMTMPFVPSEYKTLGTCDVGYDVTYTDAQATISYEAWDMVIQGQSLICGYNTVWITVFVEQKIVAEYSLIVFRGV